VLLAIVSLPRADPLPSVLTAFGLPVAGTICSSDAACASVGGAPSKFQSSSPIGLGLGNHP
jgi:hypothetical protein